MKTYLAIDLMIDGSRQDYLELSKRELHLLSTALGEAVVGEDGEDRKPFLKLMRKMDKLLARWESELDDLKTESAKAQKRKNK